MPPRSEITEARPATRRVTPPPLENWVSPSLVVLINHAPTNPALRGLLRNELDIPIPRNRVFTTEELVAFLNEKFVESKVYLLKLRQYIDAGQTPPNLYPPRPRTPTTDSPPRPTDPFTATIAAAGQLAGEEPPPRYQIDPDGSFIMRGVRLQGTEHGTAEFEASIIYTGEIRIPADVVSQGRDAVLEFLRNNRRDLQESTENYLYPEEGFVSRRVNITGIQIPEDYLAAAMRVAAGQPAEVQPARPVNPRRGRI